MTLFLIKLMFIGVYIGVKSGVDIILISYIMLQYVYAKLYQRFIGCFKAQLIIESN